MKYHNMECKKLVSEGTKTTRICLTSLAALICITMLIIVLLIIFHPSYILIDDGGHNIRNNSEHHVYNETSFLLNPAHICLSIEPDISKNKPKIEKLAVKAMVLILSSPENKDLRQTIRETWGSLGRRSGTSIKIAFVIGTSRQNKTLTESIRKENFRNKDIIQPDIEDNEENYTFKSAALLKWAAEYCPNAKYIIKAEDNAFVDMQFLMKTLANDEKYQNGSQFISSYKIATNDNQKDFLTQNSRMNIQDEIGNMRPHIESTYVIGNCAIKPLIKYIIGTGNKFNLDKNLLNHFGIKLIDDHRLWKRPPPTEWTQFKGLISAHGYDGLQMKSLWQEFVDDALTQIMQLDKDENSTNYCS